ncbi:hypothetical protein BJV78DRAFT_1124573 [Lactifluus subvellereus]|nr:hypothetical protein BJV78DRAFT_1124573 [Lactifluus subvellereus]
MIPPSSLLLISLFSLTNAYTWKFTSQPRQCQSLSLAVSGSGNPPYSLLIIPTGPSPLQNNTEVRTIQNIPFSGTSNTLTFQLNYPANSSFVAVVSDSSGFGSGGTSTPVTVLQSSDSSCYNSSRSVQGPWVFSVNPTGGITQCESVRLWWEPSFVNGTVKFYGVIPGGNSFNIPQGSLSTDTNTGTGFNWVVDIAGGTNILVVAGDDRGIGAGGSAPFTVAYASNGSCLTSNSPSSTAGSPAGGSYPTSPSDNTSTGTLLITGGVVGGLVSALAVVLIALFFFRRRKYSAVSLERPVNVLQDDEDGHEAHQDLPHYFTPEPYLVPDPTIGGTSDAASTQNRPLSMTTADIHRPLTPVSTTSATTTTRKTGAPPQLRPVNIIQHDDAGPSEEPVGQGEPETIELPPAYTNLRSSPLAASAPTTAADTDHTSTLVPVETNS